MTSIENYKSNMSSGLKTFFGNYEIPLKDLISELDRLGFLKTSNFTQDEFTRLRKIAENSNSALSILNDFNKVMSSNTNQMRKNIQKLGEAGWTIDPETRVALQYGSILSLTYHTFLERLKNTLIAYVKWDQVVTNPSKIYGIGDVLRELKNHIPNNSYLNYFNSGIRNSIAHFTFFWQNQRIYFCDGLFDQSPTSKSLTEFMIEIKNINALVEGLQLAYRDHLGLPEVNNFVE